MSKKHTARRALSAGRARLYAMHRNRLAQHIVDAIANAERAHTPEEIAAAEAALALPVDARQPELALKTA
jgi:hypothetical protein